MFFNIFCDELIVYKRIEILEKVCTVSIFFNSIVISLQLNKIVYVLLVVNINFNDAE